MMRENTYNLNDLNKNNCLKENITLLNLIIHIERILRIRFSYFLGDPISRKKLNEFRQAIPFFKGLNLYDITTIFACISEERNKILHRGYKPLDLRLSKSFCCLINKKNNKLSKENVLFLYSLFDLKVLNKNYENIVEMIYNIKDNIEGDAMRKLRNYILHGYYFNEINKNGDQFSKNSFLQLLKNHLILLEEKKVSEVYKTLENL